MNKENTEFTFNHPKFEDVSEEVKEYMPASMIIDLLVALKMITEQLEEMKDDPELTAVFENQRKKISGQLGLN